MILKNTVGNPPRLVGRDAWRVPVPLAVPGRDLSNLPRPVGLVSKPRAGSQEGRKEVVRRRLVQ